MRDGFYRQTGAVEGRHWWFRHRRRLLTALLDQEISELPCPDAREALPEAALLRVDANRLGDCFAAGSFDLVTVLNVLYHQWVSDERVVLDQVRRILRPGGRLLLTEPAFESLRRRHDRVDLGARRYTRRRLVEIVEGAGFAVQRASCFNAIGLAPAVVAAAIDRLRGAGDTEAAVERTGELHVPPVPLNWLLLELCRLELLWLRGVGDLPFGVGVLVLARTEGES